MEVKSISIETSAPDELFPKLCLELEKLGFEDIHKKALESTCCNLKETLNIDFMKRASFKKKVKTPRPHVFINIEMNGVVMFSEPEEDVFVTGQNAFEVTCFSKTQNEVKNLVETLKRLLEQSGLSKDTIHDGDFDENSDKHFIRSISETPRSGLVKEVNIDIVKVFTQSDIKKGLRRLLTFPLATKFFREDEFTFFEEDTVIAVNPHNLVTPRIMEEKFALECKRCETPSTVAPLFDSKKDASSALQQKVLVCASCGNKLNSANAKIQSYFGFTDLGLQCTKGLWLEAYVKSILEELGVKGNRIKCCAVHGKDELDLVFTCYGNLYVCECRDRIVGRNDVYVLAMKVSRINEDEETDAIVDKVLMVSTEPIPKDIIPTEEKEEEEKPKYLFISGDGEEIKKELVQTIRKARQKYRRERRKELSLLLLDILPPTADEVYDRGLEEGYFPY